MSQSQLLTLFPREPTRPQRGRTHALALAVLLHLPFFTFLAIVLLFAEPLPESKLIPDLEVSLIPPPRIETRQPPPLPFQRPKPASSDAATRSSQRELRPPAQPPVPPPDPQQDTAAAESSRLGRPEQKEHDAQPPLSTPPEPLTGDSAGVPSAALPPRESVVDNDPNGVVRQRRGAAGEQNDDDLPPRPRSSRGVPDGEGKALDFRQRLSKGYQGNIRFDNNDYDWDDYQTKIYWLVYREWLRQLLNASTRFRREEFQKGLSDIDSECRIHFVIHRDGRTSDIEVTYEGEVVTLAEASSRTLSQVSPLPPLPDEAPREAEGVTYTFIVYGNTSAAALEFGLSRERAAGYF